MSTHEQHKPTVSYWQAIAANAQAEAKQKGDEWCALKDQVEGFEATIASQSLTIQGMIADGDAMQRQLAEARSWIQDTLEWCLCYGEKGSCSFCDTDGGKHEPDCCGIEGKKLLVSLATPEPPRGGANELEGFSDRTR